MWSMCAPTREVIVEQSETLAFKPILILADYQLYYLLQSRSQGDHLCGFLTQIPVFFNTVLYKFGNYVPGPVFFLVFQIFLYVL